MYFILSTLVVRDKSVTDSNADECALAIEALIKTHEFDGSIKNKQ